MRRQSWIDHSVQQIDDQIEDHKHRREQEGGRLDDGIVAIVDTLNQCIAHARQAKDDFHHRRSAHQPADLKANDGDDRDERVSQGVVKQDATWPRALGVRGAHIVLPEDLQHAGARHAHDRRHEIYGDCRRGEDELREIPQRIPAR